MSGLTHESAHNISVDWFTPPEIFDALGLTFDLDPCSPGAGKSFVPAKRHLTLADDGLRSAWTGTVWCNPPYGTQTQKWLAKLAAHGDGLALVFARTDTQWFHRHAVKADLICLIESRVRFFQGNKHSRGGSPGAGSMLLAYGPASVEAVQRSQLGACLRVVS